MAKYVLLYEGGSMPETDAERDMAMKAWEAWFQTLGGGVVDQGNPFAPASKRVKADGSITSGAGATSGYSIIEADSLDAATDAAKGCPVLAGGASVGVFEIFPVM
jgi:hypothetical protein